MLVPRRSPLISDQVRVDERVAMLRRELARTEADPFDDAMVAAVAGLAGVTRAYAAELDALQDRMQRLAHRASR